ncbi:MAG: LAGLIDADG family homing endonuclease [Nanoarchaeota archaeon]
MANILDEIMKFIPNKDDISDSYFEGANIILYTKNKNFFISNNGMIRDIVNSIKKRVELRCDPSILESEEKTKKIIEELIPAEAGLGEIIFDKQRSIVIIEADKPGLVIGKGGGLLKEIRQKTFWVPVIRRNPPIRSQIIENIRKVLYENNDYRKKFLHNIGKRIYDGWIREKKHEWVRITFLGGAREVGRSCLFLQTPESRILLDCGFNVAASGENAYPYLDVPEFNIKELDAIILCHPHIDHCGFLNYLYKYGFKGPTYCTEPTRDVSALLALDLLGLAHKEAKKALYSSTDIKDFVKHSVCLDYGEVTDITPDVRLTFYNAGHNIGCVKGDTMIVLQDGSIKPISEIVTNPNPTPVIAMSLTNDLTIKPAIGTAFKREYYGDLYKVKTNCGSVIVTKEHPFFVLKDSQVKNKKAKDLLNNDYIAVPSKINIAGERQRLDKNFIKGKAKNSLHIKIPNNTNSKVVRVIGYLLGDGCRLSYKKRTSKYLTITDKNINNLKRYASVTKEVFNVKPKIVKRKCRKSYSIIINSTELVNFLDKNFLNILVRSPNRKIPQIICKTTNKEISSFLGGLFDAEGSISKDNIEINMTSKDIIEKVKILLLRFGIISQQSSKKQSGKGKHRVYRLFITEKESINKFYKNIILFDDNKKAKLSNLLKKKGATYYSKRGLPNISEEIKYVRKLLRLDRKDFNLSIKHYESGYHKISNFGLDNILNIFEKRLMEFKNLKENLDKYSVEFIKEKLNASLYELGNALNLTAQRVHYMIKKNKENKKIRDVFLQIINKAIKDFKLFYNLNFFKTLLRSDIRWEKIKIKKMNNKFKRVYDLSIPAYRSFITNGILSHNSSMAHLHIGNGLHNLLYTSDMNYELTNLLSPAATKFPRLETLIIESTYGHREDVFPTRKECDDYLISLIKKTIENGGKVLLPVLGVGRSQEILLILERAIREGRLNKMPIFIQGMVWDVTAIHTAYPEFFNSKVKKDIFHKDQNPFLADVFKRIVGKKEMMQVINEEGPCVIVATSGMLTGGASLEYFKHLAENPKNILVLTCYQGQGSLGRRLEDGEREIMDNETKTMIKVRMGVYIIKGFSGHSNYQQLINFVGRLDPRPKKVLCNHGESSKCIELASAIHKIFRIETSAPKNLEVIRLK